MSFCSHITNSGASHFVRTSGNDFRGFRSHNANMARRGIPKDSVNWFIREWMDTLRVRQKDMIREAGWSKATASQIYNGQQDYSPKLVNEAAKALKIQPYELLMHPEEAMRIRHLLMALRPIEGGPAPVPPVPPIAAVKIPGAEAG